MLLLNSICRPLVLSRNQSSPSLSPELLHAISCPYINRDLKPENVFIKRRTWASGCPGTDYPMCPLLSCRVVVADMGLADLQVGWSADQLLGFLSVELSCSQFEHSACPPAWITCYTTVYHSSATANACCVTWQPACQKAEHHGRCVCMTYEHIRDVYGAWQ